MLPFEKLDEKHLSLLLIYDIHVLIYIIQYYIHNIYNIII